MPLTANRELARYVDQELRSLGVAADTHIWKGAIVGIERATGLARNLVAGDLFAGIAYEEKNNTDGDAGDLAVRVYTQGDFALAVNTATQAWAGAPVYAIGDDVTTVANAVGASYVGRLIAVTGTNAGIVRIEPMAASQVEQVISVPLASSTSAATTNAVMITQRAIKIVSAQVAFNTVPNSGALDLGTDSSDPDEVIDNFNLASLTANVAANLTLAGRDVAKNTRIWAKVSIATTTAGVGGVLTLRFFELP